MNTTISYDGKLDIATGKSRKELNWTNKQVLWSKLVQKLSTTHRTAETAAEYIASSKDRQDEIKDIGGFVGGSLTGGRRKAGSVAHRQLATLDIDFAPKDFWTDFVMFYGNAAALYSTHKHCPEAPRLRLVIPLDREVFADEYQAICRRIAGDLGIDYFDHTTFEPSRLMYWPSTSKDAEYVFEFQDGPWLCADEILKSFNNWKDSSEWPLSSREEKKIIKIAESQGDPLEKPGLIGAFCRTYTISEAIETFLNDVYSPCGIPNRYTYKEGSTAGGLVLYDDKFSYSHHSTDPVSGKLCNAFDLVRIHKFGLKDSDVKENTPVNKLPSFECMAEFVSNDSNTKKALSKEVLQNAKTDFKKPEKEIDTTIEEIDTDWLTGAEYDRKGNLKATHGNINLIMKKDPVMNGLMKNDFSGKIEVSKPFPNDKKKSFKVREFTDEDRAEIICYIESVYDIRVSNVMLDIALGIIRGRNIYHPVKDYLSSVEWDGAQRIDTLLIDYLGAEDNQYVRDVTRKTLVAAVARIFEPGIKFDHVLTLVGDQGIGKSTLVKKLGVKWYSDSFSFHQAQKKDGYEQLRGFWLIEAGEMGGLKKAEIEAVKQFITSTEDTYRRAFGHETVTNKRQCIFLGTTNNYDFLSRANGNRRFWPVDLYEHSPIKNVFTDLSETEIAQIWAEALQVWENGETLKLNPAVEELAFKQQELHEESDELKPIIEEFLDRQIPSKWYEIKNLDTAFEFDSAFPDDNLVERPKVCVTEIWTLCMGKRKTDIDVSTSRRINNIMRTIPGWKRTKTKQRFGSFGISFGYERIKKPVANAPVKSVANTKKHANHE